MDSITRLARRFRLIADVRQLFLYATSTTYQWQQPQFRLRLPSNWCQNPEADFEKGEREVLRKLSPLEEPDSRKTRKNAVCL